MPSRASLARPDPATLQPAKGRFVVSLTPRLSQPRGTIQQNQRTAQPATGFQSHACVVSESLERGFRVGSS